MFKASLIPVLAFFAGQAQAQAQTKFDLFSVDEKIGTGTYRESIDHKGRKTREVKIWSKLDSYTKVAIDQTKVIDKQGFPIREEEHIVQEIGRVRTERVIKVRYDDTGAALLSETRGKTRYTDRMIMPIPGYSRADASDLWFSQITPAPGTTVTSTVLDIENERWQVVETTFTRRKWIIVGGRQVEANEVRDIRDGVLRMVYLDDKGQPLVMRKGTNRTERHF